MKKIFICLFGALFLTPEITSAAARQSLQEQKPQPEKLHLHLDRTFYAVSDTVWFKAYLTDAITHKLLPGPEVIHLDLISEDNQSVLSRQLITSQGTVAGNLIIPDSLKTGSYLVQAYTTWQRNAGPQTFFRQPVYVVGASRSPGEQAAGKTVGKPDEKVLKSLEFFPESGRLLPGFELKVAFKALAADGAGIPVKGDLLDEAGKVILTFSAEANGSGSFRLQPQPGKTYTAKVINGSEVRHFPMPIATSGQTFRVRSTPDSVQLTFFSNSQGQPAPVLLLLKSQGNLLSSDSLQFNSNGFRKRAFAKKNWPEGVVQIALQDEKGTIMNERLFFNQQVSPVNVLLKTDRNMYNRRQPVLVSISLQDKNGLPLETELSVTATTEHETINPTLRESLLLASDLNASVSAAGSRQPDPEVLDNMLLTFGSGSLQSALAVKKTDAAVGFPRETTLKPQGLVTENGKAISKAIIYLLDTRTGASHLASASEKGTFVLPAYGNRFFYQVWQNGTLLEQAKLHFLPVEAVLPAAAWNLNFRPDSAMVAKTTLRRKIEKVYAETSLETSGKAARIELWPTYPADKYFPLEDYKELRNLEEILREIVPVTRIINRDNIVQANVYNSDIRTFYPHQPLYIIDGQPTWNHDLMLRLDGAQLRQINLYTSAKKLEPFGFFGNNGVIVVITKSRNYRAPELNSEHIWQVPGQGAYGAFRTYNRPVNKPDLRPTLYWNPSLRTAADGTATLNFQTSDEVGPIRIKVEGITRDGQLISEELLVPVQPPG